MLGGLSLIFSFPVHLLLPSFLSLLFWTCFICLGGSGSAQNNCNDHAAMSGKVAQTACMSACKHLSTSLMQMLLDSELKQISMGAVQQFNLDVIQCECKWS
uniref:Exocyst complex subunit EXOC6/Sec15 C-terminal domain-containing protein n=1 Tax=Hucho hucho TaxID=62062 RepID=A0A4W5JGS9_9TELE